MTMTTSHHVPACECTACKPHDPCCDCFVCTKDEFRPNEQILALENAYALLVKCRVSVSNSNPVAWQKINHAADAITAQLRAFVADTEEN